VAAVVVFALMLRREEQVRRFGVQAGRAASWLLRLVRRPPVAGWELATVKFRTRTLDLVEHRWVAITAATLVSHLSLFLVLLLILRHLGGERGRGRLGAGAGGVRVRAAGHRDPAHPGAGVVEAVLIGGLVAAGGAKPELVAAVLVYRALTWLLPIPIEVGCYVWWQRWPCGAGGWPSGWAWSGSACTPLPRSSSTTSCAAGPVRCWMP
jgi:putative heme transporter